MGLVRVTEITLTQELVVCYTGSDVLHPFKLNKPTFYGFSQEINCTFNMQFVLYLLKKKKKNSPSQS